MKEGVKNKMVDLSVLHTKVFTLKTAMPAETGASVLNGKIFRCRVIYNNSVMFIDAGTLQEYLLLYNNDEEITSGVSEIIQTDTGYQVITEYNTYDLIDIAKFIPTK